jgi:zinc-RING finger domain
MLPSCGICLEDFDPVETVPVILPCDHIWCGRCAEGLVEADRACPCRCRDSTPVRPRDFRDLQVSITSTSAVDNDDAVAGYVLSPQPPLTI